MAIPRYSESAARARVLHKADGFLSLQLVQPSQSRLAAPPGLESNRPVGANGYVRFYTTPANVVSPQVESILTIAQAFEKVADGKLIIGLEVRF